MTARGGGAGRTRRGAPRVEASPPAPLAAALERAFALTGDATEARSLVFGVLVATLARSRGRLGAEVPWAAALAGYRVARPAGAAVPALAPAAQGVLALGVPAPPTRGALALAEAALDALAAQLAPVAAALGDPADAIALYERSLSWTPDAPTAGARPGDPADGAGDWPDGARPGDPSDGARERRAAGAFFTPPAVVERLLGAAFDPVLDEAAVRGAAALGALRVCDPACGAGSFLLAAHRRLSTALAASGALGAAEARALVALRGVHGVDRDPAAVELCRALLWLATDLAWRDLPRLTHLQVADSLTLDWPRAFPEAFAAGGFDAVVGNPPFLNQLEGRSARPEAQRAALRARFAEAAGGYADTAVAFLLLGAELLRPGGRSTLIAPLSALGARDASAARTRLARATTLEALWVATDRVFADAAVRVWAGTLRAGGARRGPLARRRDAAFTAAGAVELDMDALAGAPTWGPLVADLVGIPRLALALPVEPRGAAAPPRTFADVALVTADFRDQFYGLRGLVVEDADVAPADRERFPPLITAGLVDLAACRWGERPTRFDGQRWAAPRVDLARLERAGKLGPWAQARRVPKVLLATQTRALEAVVDERGAWLPSIPLITLVPTAEVSLWHLAAAVCSPPVAAVAAARLLGTALAVDAIKPSAAAVRALPLPAPGAAWDEGAAELRRAQEQPAERAAALGASARALCRAYALTPAETAEVLAWWTPRALGAAGDGGSGR